VYQQVEESGEKSCDMVRERGEEREQMWQSGDHGGRHGDVLGVPVP
jgi:hypothetical protein